MANPSLSLTIQDPGIGLAEPLTNLPPLIMGTSSAGTANTVVSMRTPADVVSTFGQGPLAEDACTVLTLAGGPVLCLKMTGGVAGAAGSVTKSAVDSSTGTVTVSGAAYDAYEVIVEITTTGTLGAGAFRYTLDGGYTYSAPITIPSGGTYAIADTNLTLTFVPGAGAVYFEAGDTHSFDCTAPHPNATNIATAFTAIAADSRQFRFVAIAGDPADSSTAATNAAAIATGMTSLQTAFKYARAIYSAGPDAAATTVTAFAAVTGPRVAYSYAYTGNRITSAKPITGWSTPLRNTTGIAAARAAANAISTHLGRVASGSLTGVLSIGHDNYTAAVDMDAAGFLTTRTWPLLDGFYFTRGRIKAALGSDFQRLELGFIMDVACATVVRALTTQANKTVRTLTDGSGRIDPLDAADWREVALKPLRSALTEPLNAEGTKGHVSGLDVTIDETNDVLTGGVVLVHVALVPLGYVETIAINVGYATAI